MERYVDCHAGLVEGNKMYIPGLTYAFLLEYNLKNWEQHCLADYTDLFKEKPAHIIDVFKEGDYMYLVLRNSFRILEYDFKTGQAVFMGEQPIYADSEELVSNALRIGNEIWSIPRNIRDNIHIFDIGSKKFTEFSVLEQMAGYENISGFLECTACGDSIYLTVYGEDFSNLICQILCNEKKVKFWHLREDMRLYTISFYKGEIWLSDFQNPSYPVLCRWERERGILETIELEKINWRERDIRQGYCLLREVIAYQDKLIVIPRLSNEITVINRAQNIQRKLEYPVDFRRVMGSEDREMFRGICVQDQRVFLFPCACNGILILDMETEELELRELYLNKEIYKEYCKMYFEGKSGNDLQFSEGELIGYDRGEFLLPDYIEQVKLTEGNSQFVTAGTSGKRIYDFLTEKEARKN